MKPLTRSIKILSIQTRLKLNSTKKPTDSYHLRGSTEVVIGNGVVVVPEEKCERDFIDLTKSKDSAVFTGVFYCNDRLLFKCYL